MEPEVLTVKICPTHLMRSFHLKFNKLLPLSRNVKAFPQTPNNYSILNWRLRWIPPDPEQPQKIV